VKRSSSIQWLHSGSGHFSPLLSWPLPLPQKENSPELSWIPVFSNSHWIANHTLVQSGPFIFNSVYAPLFHCHCPSLEVTDPQDHGNSLLTLHPLLLPSSPDSTWPKDP
jgi:hypothetical protein